MTATVLLSKDGLVALGRLLKPGRRPERAVRGSVLGYQAEGVWFQDERLLRAGQMVLIKWHFVEASLSDVAISQPLPVKAIGFAVATVE